MGIEISDTTQGISQIQHVSWGHLKGDMGYGGFSDRGQSHFLNSTCGMGDSPINGPRGGNGEPLWRGLNSSRAIAHITPLCQWR